MGGFNPSEKYESKIGSFPQVGVQQNIWNHHLDMDTPSRKSNNSHNPWEKMGDSLEDDPIRRITEIGGV